MDEGDWDMAVLGLSCVIPGSFNVVSNYLLELDG
jgi:hypothetical protein